MHFEKYEATGNDFLITDSQTLENSNFDFSYEGLSDLARRICHRNFGVGADGLLVLDQPGIEKHSISGFSIDSNAHCRMYLINADGSHAEMSGNGIRCFASFAGKHGFSSLLDDDHKKVVVETKAGIKEIILRYQNGSQVGDVDMGKVTFEPDDIPVKTDDPYNIPHYLLGVERQGFAVNSGVPHWVLLLDNRSELEHEDLSHEALVARYDQRFPELTNVSVALIESTNRVTARVFERGAHETLSCGTGATAIATALHNAGIVDNSVTVSLRGGELLVTMGDTNILSGPVNFIASVDYQY